MTTNTEHKPVDYPSYRAEQCGGAWFCVTGDDFAAAPMYDTEEDAQDAADEMNGRFYADGRPANSAARALVGAA